MARGMPSARNRARLLIAVASCVALLVTACGDDGTDDSVEDVEDVGATPATVPGEEPKGDDDVREVAVRAVEYAFEDLPATVEPGSRFTLVNGGEEAHELVVYRLADDEDRSADEIAQLDTAELLELFSYPPDFVLLAGPGEEGAPAPDLGDGTVTEPGRYIATCVFDVGTTELPDGPPTLADPHFRHGMYGEFTVE
jgi:plastocyanin